MEKFQFIWSGETELPAGWALRPHSHDFFHLAYVKSGNLVFYADGTDYNLSGGSLILIPPFAIHGVPEDTHNLCIQYEVFFQIQNPALKHLFESSQVLVLHDASHLENLFAYIKMHYRDTDSLNTSCTESFLCTILFSFLTYMPNSKGVSENSSSGYVDASLYSPLVQRILSHVEKNFNEKHNLSNLALSLGFSKSYLCIIFRRETGITISDYINYNRIRKILIMLQYNGYNKDFPVYKLAHQFGYTNPSYFNRVFKKYTGMTPTEFINALFKGSDNSKPSSFQKYYIEYLDMKRYSIQESLEYMRGLKAAAETDECSDHVCKESKNSARL